MTLTGIDDPDDDDNETVIVDITMVSNGTETGTQQVTAIIIDDDGIPSIALGVSGSSIAENGGIATVTATASNIFASNITVGLAFSGTAINLIDYTRSADQIVIPAGNLSGNITLMASDDLLDEVDERITVDVNSVTNGTEIGTQQITVTILDDDSPPSVTLSVSGSPIAENGGTGIVTAMLSAVSFQPVNVNLVVSGTAESTDYSIMAQQIVVLPGDISAILEITAIDDQTDEEDETIIMAIVDVANGTSDGEQEVTAVIEDDDEPPTLEVSGLTANGVSVLEGDAGISTSSVNLSLGNSSEKAISVLYSTIDGTATVVSDYTAIAPTTISFAAGETSKDISLAIVGDALAEGDESFQILLTDPVNTGLSSTSITVIIIDDDASPSVGDDQYQTNEDEQLSIAGPGVLDNDSDMDMDALVLSVLNDPENGDLILNQDGSFSYTPKLNFNGLDDFEYEVSDGTNKGSASVEITIIPVNDPPTISQIEDQVIFLGGILGPLNFEIDDPDTSPESLALELTIDINELFLPEPEPFSGSGPQQEIQLEANAEQTGEALVTITVSDGELETSMTFKVTIVIDNDSPTDILLSDNTIEEGLPTGTLIGELSTIDPDPEDEHTYTLVEGDGDEDNGLFVIEGDQLLSNQMFEFGVQNTSSIRVQSSDGDASFEKTFLIMIIEKPVSKVLYLPNLFTPNNDGQNDLFILRGEGIGTIDFRVFNKFGDLVFGTNNATVATSTGWNGTAGGRDQPAGSYIWQLNGIFTDGSPLLVDGKTQGNITLLR